MGRKRIDRVARYDFITKEATDRSQARTHKERLQFDYFNPNGAWKQHMDMVAIAHDAVKKEIIAGGALIAYDAAYHYKHLVRLAMRNCSCSPFESTYYGDQIRITTEKLRQHMIDKGYTEFEVSNV